MLRCRRAFLARSSFFFFSPPLANCYELHSFTCFPFVVVAFLFFLEFSAEALLILHRRSHDQTRVMTKCVFFFFCENATFPGLKMKKEEKGFCTGTSRRSFQVRVLCTFFKSILSFTADSVFFPCKWVRMYNKDEKELKECVCFFFFLGKQTLH